MVFLENRWTRRLDARADRLKARRPWVRWAVPLTIGASLTALGALVFAGTIEVTDDRTERPFAGFFIALLGLGLVGFAFAVFRRVRRGGG